MKAVTFSAQISDFEYVAEKYIYGRDIHLEKAMNIMTNRKRIQSFDENTDYDLLAKNAMSIMKLAGCAPNPKLIAKDGTTLESMQKFVDGINERIRDERDESDHLHALIEKNRKLIEKLDLMLDVDVDLQKIFGMEFIKVQFGHIPRTGYKTLTTYLDNLETFFIVTAENATEVWGFYFVPAVKQRKIEEVFASLYFEPESVTDEFPGTPRDIKKYLTEQNAALEARIKELSEKTAKMLADSADKLVMIYNLAKKREQFAEIRRNAVHSDMFFYVVGWMESKDADALEKEINESGDVVMFYSEDASNVKEIDPPTKLKNNFIFKPFEMFVKMYGLPSYGEIDPTPILAITYILFFGIMFGDVGQSAVLAIAGFIIYKVKKMDLAGIIGMVGLAGIVTGFIYGSFFGNEEIIPQLFGITTVKPMQSIMPLLIGTVCMGACIIIFGMCLNVVNMFKRKDIGDAVFGHNGIAGIVFYLSVILVAVNLLAGLGIPSVVFIVLFAVSLLAMYLCTPLTRLVEHKKHWLPANGMFFVENFFELFEVILSFCTNTISFLRIGAFAVIHVGMMMAVQALSGSGGVGGMMVTVVGNIIVMILEGLIVAIQVLRLEYYEMFSRYFQGNGKEFVSLKNK